MKKVVRGSSTRDRIEYLETKIQILEDFIDNHKYGNQDELVDAQIELDELKEQLNFAWQDDEAEWDYARNQQEFNPDGSLKLYGSTQTIQASYEDRFWKLHDNYDSGITLEEIIDDLGLTDKFFPETGEPTATEADYKLVLDDFGGDNITDIADVVEATIRMLGGLAGVKSAHYEPEIDAIRFRLSNNKEYQFVIQQLHF